MVYLTPPPCSASWVYGEWRSEWGLMEGWKFLNVFWQSLSKVPFLNYSCCFLYTNSFCNVYFYEYTTWLNPARCNEYDASLWLGSTLGPTHIEMSEILLVPFENIWRRAQMYDVPHSILGVLNRYSPGVRGESINMASGSVKRLDGPQHLLLGLNHQILILKH